MRIVKIIIPGNFETIECGLPSLEVSKAIGFIEVPMQQEFKSVSPDAVSLVWCACEKKGIPCTIIYNGEKLKDLDAAFKIFNEGLDLMDTYLEECCE